MVYDLRSKKHAAEKLNPSMGSSKPLPSESLSMPPLDIPSNLSSMPIEILELVVYWVYNLPSTRQEPQKNPIYQMHEEHRIRTFDKNYLRLRQKFRQKSDSLSLLDVRALASVNRLFYRLCCPSLYESINLEGCLTSAMYSAYMAIISRHSDHIRRIWWKASMSEKQALRMYYAPAPLYRDPKTQFKILLKILRYCPQLVDADLVLDQAHWILTESSDTPDPLSDLLTPASPQDDSSTSPQHDSTTLSDDDSSTSSDDKSPTSSDDESPTSSDDESATSSDGDGLTLSSDDIIQFERLHFTQPITQLPSLTSISLVSPGDRPPYAEQFVVDIIKNLSQLQSFTCSRIDHVYLKPRYIEEVVQPCRSPLGLHLASLTHLVELDLDNAVCFDFTWNHLDWKSSLTDLAIVDCPHVSVFGLHGFVKLFESTLTTLKLVGDPYHHDGPLNYDHILEDSSGYRFPFQLPNLTELTIANHLSIKFLRGFHLSKNISIILLGRTPGYKYQDLKELIQVQYWPNLKKLQITNHAPTHLRRKFAFSRRKILDLENLCQENGIEMNVIRVKDDDEYDYPSDTDDDQLSDFDNAIFGME
ncbi:uncharacterized protein MELLADRAFT_84639 [Melampsora larici-populina 98AG31]|uniref:Uncharacterized protein n=1 Tax=Melampsora larici-populina (strain 98AG31 / pathotype 3-4-7) TaxID=747676 RepID=F4RFZ7_MELLP|nr:uncharacterized protein MELLADRAFT_84639 [Melampsora larici-populina 98AG31]EGG08462.1 hypothetical protein MELLADRAFT_84639 [Melampsora larici-populina 98AG31]